MVEAVVLKGHVFRVHLEQLDMIEPVAVFLLSRFVEHFCRNINTDDLTIPGIERKRDTGAHTYIDHPLTLPNSGFLQTYLDSREKNMEKRLVVDGRISAIDVLHILLIHGLEITDKTQVSQEEP